MVSFAKNIRTAETTSKTWKMENSIPKNCFGIPPASVPDQCRLYRVSAKFFRGQNLTHERLTEVSKVMHERGRSQLESCYRSKCRSFLNLSACHVKTQNVQKYYFKKCDKKAKIIFDENIHAASQRGGMCAFSPLCAKPSSLGNVQKNNKTY